MFVLYSIVIILVLVSIYKFSDKWLIPLINRRSEASSKEASDLYDEAASIAKKANKNADVELKKAKTRKEDAQKVVSKKFNK